LSHFLSSRCSISKTQAVVYPQNTSTSEFHLFALYRLADEIFDDEGYGVFEAYRVEKEDRIA
jgi:hypothetical protein